ncbi:endonuclease V [Halocalculus aciditolerans]|uniref:Endonuclease V n=1 Tax=Halocalculus aciditolerans TaxID=1383812 RepID=A0A830F507_9EURY|nr:endonuclease V [Halocalculus aciditolerans]GGL63592.1 endonuclease V [Halocalculus aciditolerans]
MEVVHPEYVPDPALSREEMEALQRDLAADAVFSDDLDVDPAEIALDEPPTENATLGGDADAPVVVGIDQAFTDDEAVSAAVAIRDGSVVETVEGRAPLDIPYIPGLLAFREGGCILDALRRLDVDPDLLVLDGSGRIHFREAGIATHIGVAVDTPSVGVAKNLLCGTPRTPLDEGPFPEGTKIPIEADDSMTTPDGTVVGHALQSRQYPNPERRHVNPLVVSPGHRVSAETTVGVVDALCAGYKLPEPTRLADAAADDLKSR